MRKNSVVSSYFVLLLGIGLYTLVTWKWNVAVAAWLAPVLLVRYFRDNRRWYLTLPAALLLCAASYANKAGAWGMDPALEVVVSALAALPMIAALYLDQFASRRLPPLASMLVFPAAFVSLDFAISFLPLGTVFSWSVSQFSLAPLIQIAAVTGVWGIEFLLLWAAPVINSAWETGFAGRAARAPLAIYAVCLAVVLLLGGLRMVVDRPVTLTVRVAGVTVAHARNYWDVLIDQGTPVEQVRALAPEFKTLEDQLFVESERAARGGAQIIFWSEADAFILPGEKEAFLQRTRDFARQQQVYIMPAYQVLRYGDTSGFNGLALITPQGEIAYEYEKTKSWYATTSDGVLRSVDTPYGRIGAVICFDLDFPSLVHQAAQQGVDVLLVPAFDTYQTRVYHTEVGLLRGVEDGVSVMRVVNEGTSMAVDYRGNLLAWQDFFTPPSGRLSRVLVADLPTQGVTTFYGKTGDWLAWLCILLTAGAVLAASLRPKPVLATA